MDQEGLPYGCLMALLRLLSTLLLAFVFGAVVGTLRWLLGT